jgi:hypothetical protein
MPSEPHAGVIDPTVERFEDLNSQLDDARWCEELAGLLPFRHCKLAKEVFVDFAERITFDIHRHGGKVLQERNEQFFVEPVVRSRQSAS